MGCPALPSRGDCAESAVNRPLPRRNAASRRRVRCESIDESRKMSLRIVPRAPRSHDSATTLEDGRTVLCPPTSRPPHQWRAVVRSPAGGLANPCLARAAQSPPVVAARGDARARATRATPPRSSTEIRRCEDERRCVRDPEAPVDRSHSARHAPRAPRPRRARARRRGTRRGEVPIRHDRMDGSSW